MKKIYLGIPYSGTAKERADRFAIVNYVAGVLIDSGNIVMSPISQGHPIAVSHDLPTDWKYWRDVCRSFIDWCDCVYIVTVDGWKESIGVQAEIEYANKSGKEVILIDLNGEVV